MNRELARLQRHSKRHVYTVKKNRRSVDNNNDVDEALKQR